MTHGFDSSVNRIVKDKVEFSAVLDLSAKGTGTVVGDATLGPSCTRDGACIYLQDRNTWNGPRAEEEGGGAGSCTSSNGFGASKHSECAAHHNHHHTGPAFCPRTVAPLMAGTNFKT
jgi:hypothetical protein